MAAGEDWTEAIIIKKNLKMVLDRAKETILTMPCNYAEEAGKLDSMKEASTCCHHHHTYDYHYYN